MIKARLLFRKEGRAQYISHLDLMHTMQRAFIRAGVRIRHTEGFNPHPYMSFLLPLPVGCESVCELMDFDLEDGVDPVDVPQRLNDAAPEGITAVEVYPRSRKGAELKWLRVEGILAYDAGVPEDACRKLSSLFAAETLKIRKRTKKGETELDLSANTREIVFAPPQRTRGASGGGDLRTTALGESRRPFGGHRAVRAGAST